MTSLYLAQLSAGTVVIPVPRQCRRVDCSSDQHPGGTAWWSMGHGGTIGGTDQALAVHHSHIEVTLVTLWAHSGHTMRIAMVKYQTTYQYVCVYETHQIQ